MKTIQDLISISQYYGKDSRFVIAGGGNTSYKNAEKLWVKASGSSLASITEDGFAVLDRKKLNVLSEKNYSDNTAEREEQVKNDLAVACITQGKRPSVETSMHNVIDYAFVVHLHPTLVNGLMCSQNAENDLKKLFGEKMVYIPYTDPGYVLFKKVEDAIKNHRVKFNREPSIIWLQNHGIFVAANSIDEIKTHYETILAVLEKSILQPLPAGKCEAYTCIEEVLPALQMMLSCEGLKTLHIRKNELVKFFYNNEKEQANIVRPFTPDAIVYCKSNYIFINKTEPEKILAEAERAIPAFREKFGYLPKVLLIKAIGLVAVDDNAKQCDVVLDVFEDAMKVAYYAKSFGGAHPMTQKQIDFIDNWEVENYRRSVAADTLAGRSES